MAAHKLSMALRIAVSYYRAKLKMINAFSKQAAARATLDIFTKPYINTKKKDTLFFKQAKRFQYESEGIPLMAYNFASEIKSDKKLLLIHGFAGSCRSFEKYIVAATKKGYNVYTFDAPAHGLSKGKRLTALTYRNAVIEMMKLHGPFDAYISHSLGGLALMLALEELPHANTPKAVLIAPATESVTAADNFFGLLQLPSDLRAAFEKYLEEVKDLPLGWYSISRVLPFVNADILWVHDEDDPTTPIKDVLPLAKQKPANVKFHFTKGLGHSRIYKDAKVKKMIVDFL